MAHRLSCERIVLTGAKERVLPSRSVAKRTGSRRHERRARRLHRAAATAHGIRHLRGRHNLPFRRRQRNAHGGRRARVIRPVSEVRA